MLNFRKIQCANSLEVRRRSSTYHDTRHLTSDMSGPWRPMAGVGPLDGRLRRRHDLRAWGSLPRRGLPKFDLVALWVHDPTELPVLGVVRLFQDVASFVPKRLKYSGQVCDAIVDHEGRLAWREVLTIGGAYGPHGRSLCRIARCIGPAERCATPCLNVNTQVLLV